MLIGSSLLATTAAAVVLMLRHNNRAHPAREQSACTNYLGQLILIDVTVLVLVDAGNFSVL